MKSSLFWNKGTNKWQKILHSDVRQSATKKVISTVIAITVAFFIALIIACSVCETWGSFGEVLDKIFTSGFDSKYHNTLFSNMCILIIGGLSFIFAYKAGLFNIGISGQMVMGGTIGTIICHMCKIPTIGNQIVVVIASMVAGGIIAGIIGALKAYLKVNEVVSSIMFNWIIYFLSILLLSSLAIPHDASNLNTDAPADNLLLRMDGQSYVPLLIITGVVILIMIIVLNFSVFGRKLRVTGLSNTGALAAGYNIKANMILSMAISGLLAGLLGAMLYCGFSPNMPVTAAAKAIPQEGFNGISVGLISMCSPLASVPVSLFFSMIKTSVSDLQMIGIDNHIADVVFGIVVYGAAAISLFMNLKPYWWTLGIVKGKNYSKIKHERNMTNIELLSLSGDQCAVLKKYYVYYSKNRKAKSSLKYPVLTRFKMFRGGIAYWFATRRAKYRVWKNKRKDLVSFKYYYRQEMAHLVMRKGQVVIDQKQNKFGGWWIKLDDQTLVTKTRSIINANAGVNISNETWNKLKSMSNALKEKPFSNREIRLVSRLAYLQNIRSGLTYRNAVSKQNKLTYFTWLQTKQQAEELGLGEVCTKKQYKFAHTAYFRAYYKTYLVVKHHYNMMVKTFGRKKQLNAVGIRFDSTHLANLYMKTLKEEIGKISYLINCPLTKEQSNTVTKYFKKIDAAEKNIKSNQKQANKCRGLAQQILKKDPDKKQEANKYLYKSKIYNNNIISERKIIADLEAKINAITSGARKQENILETRKWLARKAANEKAQRKLDKIAARRGI